MSFNKLDTIATVGSYIALFLMSYNIMHIMNMLHTGFPSSAIYSSFWIVLFAAALEYLRALFVMQNFQDQQGEPDEIELTEAEKDELEEKINEIINRRN